MYFRGLARKKVTKVNYEHELIKKTSSMSYDYTESQIHGKCEAEHECRCLKHATKEIF